MRHITVKITAGSVVTQDLHRSALRATPRKNRDQSLSYMDHTFEAARQS